MRIGVDIDGVVLDFQQTWAELYQEYFDRYLPYEALRSYDALLTHTHFEDMVEFNDWFSRAGGWRNMPWVPGSRGGLDGCVARGHRIDLVTARPDCAKQDTLRWFETWIPKGTTLYFTDQKHEVPCDLYIDDTKHVIESLVANGKKAVIFDQPWNRHTINTAGSTVRAGDWHQVVEIVDHFDRTGILGLPVKETA